MPKGGTRANSGPKRLLNQRYIIGFLCRILYSTRYAEAEIEDQRLLYESKLSDMLIVQADIRGTSLVDRQAAEPSEEYDAKIDAVRGERELLGLPETGLGHLHVPPLAKRPTKMAIEREVMEELANVGVRASMRTIRRRWADLDRRFPAERDDDSRAIWIVKVQNKRAYSEFGQLLKRAQAVNTLPSDETARHAAAEDGNDDHRGSPEAP